MTPITLMNTASVGDTPAGLGTIGHAGSGPACSGPADRDRALVGAVVPAAS